jgi:predicted AAA+ superfamily ATPase
MASGATCSRGWASPGSCRPWLRPEWKDGFSCIPDRELLGQLLETFVYQELRRQASWQEQDVRLHHFRDKDGAEVDVVLERLNDAYDCRTHT